MDALVHEGVELDRHYVFQFCSPTRSAMQSGRNPIHVNTVNGPPDLSNPENADTGWAGIPRNMTGIAEHMLRAGYSTHMYGKVSVLLKPAWGRRQGVGGDLNQGQQDHSGTRTLPTTTGSYRAGLGGGGS